jgi:uncharacterized phage protein (TIGR01671 family)
MREIKFRAWDINKNVYIPTEYWAVVTTDFGAFGIMLKDWENYKEGEYFYSKFQVLEQYTGLKDKNGVEVFEGDIIGYTDVYSKITHTVIFSYGKFIANNRIRPKGNEWLSDNGKSYDLCFLMAMNNYEIIGNIHTNKDLL